LTNGVSAEIHAAPTLGSMLLARAARSPEALAFADATRQVTFGELAEGASALSGGLTRRGVLSGDRVALVPPAGVGFQSGSGRCSCSRPTPRKQPA